MLISLPEFEQKSSSEDVFARGCIVDTNVLFAASFPLDVYNAWAEKVFQILHLYKVPIFTNMNVRSEFIELNRRVLIPEGLVDLYDDIDGKIDNSIEQALKSLKTRKETAAKANQTFRFSDSDIKKFRSRFEEYKHPSGINGWELFCQDYFYPYIKDVWEDAITTLKIEFLGNREIESLEHFEVRPKWSEMVDIVGKYGVGSADAMIVNLFCKSKFRLIITADSDVAKSLVAMNLPDKYVLAP